MKKHLVASLVFASLLYFSVGCHHSSSSSDTSDNLQAADTQPARPIPPDSILAKVKTGMSENEVIATIGAATTTDTYQTGKAWIPFHYSGSDDMRRLAHYKGVGTITYSLDSAYGSSYSVISVEYDPSEPGFAK